MRHPLMPRGPGRFLSSPLITIFARDEEAPVVEWRTIRGVHIGFTNGVATQGPASLLGAHLAHFHQETQQSHVTAPPGHDQHPTYTEHGAGPLPHLTPAASVAALHDAARESTPSRGTVATPTGAPASAEQRARAAARGVIVPPRSWDVWVNPDPDGKVQATWKDAKGRTQYGYGASAIAARDAKKFGAVHAFATSLPHIRAQVQRDLALEDAHKKRVAAAAISLIDHAHLRVGSERYAQKNDTFGASSLRADHASVHEGAVTLQFTGKHNVAQRTVIDDAPTARAVDHLKSLPADQGAQTRLFRYHEGASQTLRPLTEVHVNDYLHAFGVTAKQFRTHYATSTAADLLAEAGPPRSESEARTTIARVVKAVSEQLGNTPAVCRGSYINPAVLNAYSKGIVMDAGNRGEVAMARNDERFDAHLQRLALLLKAGTIEDADPFPPHVAMSAADQIRRFPWSKPAPVTFTGGGHWITAGGRGASEGELMRYAQDQRARRAANPEEEFMPEFEGDVGFKADVTFSATDATPTDDGKDLILRGLLFKAGRYEDKAFEVTPSDLYESIRRFTAPAPLDLEHRPSTFTHLNLTGAFGTIDKLWSDDNGQTVQAEIRKPRWLHEVMPECRVSATFDRQTKDVIGAAWTSKPRVSDARMVVAFAESDEPDRIVSTFASDSVARPPGRPRHDTPDGQGAMQRLHDIAAGAGAVCQQSNALSGIDPALGMPVGFAAGGYDYSSTQINLPADLAAKVKALGKRIPDEHLADDGREDNPHATVLYGLHTTDPRAVVLHSAGAGPVSMELGPTSIVPATETGGDYDVVKVAVKSDDLHALHKRLADNLPHTSSHPTYKPHVTIAYVKKGMGQTYADDTSLQGQKATADHVTFSSKDGTVTHVPLSGQATMSAVEFASRHEHRALQHMHDTAVEHGARCHVMPYGWGLGGRDNDDVAGQPDTDDAVGMSTAQSNKRRSLRDGHKTMTRSKAMKFMDWLMGKAQEDGVTLDQDDLAATFNNSGDTEDIRVELERQSRQRDADRAEILRLRLERDEAQAVAFAERQVAAFKALPAEKEAIVFAFLRASANDRTATFAEGEPTNLAVLESMYKERPAHMLTQTAVPTDAHMLTSQGTTADFSAHGNAATTPTADGKPMARERYEQLMKSGPMTRVLLEQRQRDARQLGLAEREWAANRPAAVPDTTPAAHRPL